MIARRHLKVKTANCCFYFTSKKLITWQFHWIDLLSTMLLCFHLNSAVSIAFYAQIWRRHFLRRIENLNQNLCFLHEFTEFIPWLFWIAYLVQPDPNWISNHKWICYSFFDSLQNVQECSWRTCATFDLAWHLTSRN